MRRLFRQALCKDCRYKDCRNLSHGGKPTRRILWLEIGTRSALGLLLAFQQLQVEINGCPTDDHLVQGNKVYVSVDALRDAGAVVATQSNRVRIQFEPLHGQVQGDMIEGRIGEWLSNGIWRVRVVRVEPLTKPGYFKGKGFELTIEIRNLTIQTRTFSDGFDSMILIDEKGTCVRYLAGSFKERTERMANAGIWFRAEGRLVRRGDSPSLPLLPRGTPPTVIGTFRRRIGAFRNAVGTFQ